MGLKHLLKEARYYHLLGKGHLKRMFIKFLLSNTILSKLVNTRAYNYLYNKAVEKNTKKVYPINLQIENTNSCNAQCIMCPHTKMQRKQSIMSFENFKKICQNILPYEKIKLITITGFGEPFVDSGMIEKIKWLNEEYPKIKVDIYTNASLLTKEISNKILDLNLHKINFSINGTKNSYKKIMGLDYGKTKKNIIYFLKREKEKKQTFPLTNISLMVLKENKEEIEEVVNFWQDKVDSIMAYLPSDWAGKLNIDTAVKNPFKFKRWPCGALWKNITVDVEGNVIMCCRDYESIVKFGNVLKQNIKKIKNSKKFRDLQKKQKKHDFSTPICKTCDNCFDSSLDWWA
jgi:radical SAM protein with 4Fe4S-binding SPASM domain